RLKAADTGAPLVGAPEPLMSAPATPVENLNGKAGPGNYKKARQIKQPGKKVQSPRVATARRTTSPSASGNPSISAASPSADAGTKAEQLRNQSEPMAAIVPSRRRRVATTVPGTTGAEFDAGIVEAFRLGSNGFSADRVLADDKLHHAFADRCRTSGLAGTE